MIDSIARKLVWFGHDAFCITAEGATLYFDPFRLSGSPPPADFILVSHEHYDHYSPEDIEKIRTPQTVILTEPRAAKKLQGEVITLTPGQSFQAGPFAVSAVPSYNTNKKFHPETNSWLGFIVTVEGVRIYHAGDTDRIAEMKGFDVDIALLPVSGTYVMTAEEAAQAALEIKPKLAIPMHFGSIVGVREDAERFANLLRGKIPVIIPTPPA